jgi:hypothetical protein
MIPALLGAAENSAACPISMRVAAPQGRPDFARMRIHFALQLARVAACGFYTAPKDSMLARLATHALSPAPSPISHTQEEYFRVGILARTHPQVR